MDVLYSIVTFFLAIALGALLWSYLRLKNRMDKQESRLAALTRRVFELEGGQTQSSTVPSPEPLREATAIPEPEPEPELAPPRPKEDWETIVGASWLNRIGALVLVIGIALFLGYSLTQLGPGGKVAIGLGVGASMLLCGVALRSSERYGNFSTSLVAGGWAAIYFTVYAAHALEPARVIANPVIAGIVLFAVSVGMILHAISYRSEKVTALAFLFSFVSLNISPLTGFSIYATILLASSMLLLAYLRHWFSLAVAGIVLAYLTFILRRDASEPLAQWAIWIQWFVFEAFDLIDVRRRGFNRGITRSIFLLNACGFIGVALLYDWQRLGWFLFASAIAYLGSTFVRARFITGEPDTRTRVLGGGYEGALTASAALFAGALIEQFEGVSMTLALLVEGEMIALAGHSIRNTFVRTLGGGVLALAFTRLTLDDALSGPNDRLWTPTGGILSGIFIANRMLFGSGWAYTAGAGVVLAMVAEAELPREWFPFAWAAMVLIAIAARIPIQPLIGAGATFIAGAIANTYGSEATLPVILTVAAFYGGEFISQEKYSRVWYSVLGSALLTLLLFREAEGRPLTVALGMEGAALLIAGMFTSERVLRLSGLALFLLSIGKAFIYDLRQLDTFSRILSFIGLGLLLLGASWVYTRFRERIKRLL
jgi:uncharacterized membrane protein